MKVSEFAASYFEELRSSLDRIAPEQLERVVQALQAAADSDRAVYVAGNGGSAATASHLASDLSRTAAGTGRPGIRAFCLTDNTSAFTAMANDTSFDGAFAEMLTLQVRPGDVLIVISGSGSSPNILQAVDAARRKGATTIGMVGFDGGALAGLTDITLHVESHHYGVVEDLHMAVSHLISMYLAGPERMKNPGRRPASSLAR